MLEPPLPVTRPRLHRRARDRLARQSLEHKPVERAFGLALTDDKREVAYPD